MRRDGGGLLVPLREMQVGGLLKDGLEFSDSALQRSAASLENDWQFHLMQPPAFSLPGLLHGGKREGVSELFKSRESVFGCEAVSSLDSANEEELQRSSGHTDARNIGPDASVSADVLSRTAVWFETILRRKQARDEAVGSCDS